MKRLKSLLYSQKLAPYVFVAPFVIVFLVFFLYPIISTVVMSFQSVVPGQTHFIGFENYRKRNESVRADAYAEGRRDVAAVMLPVLDNLQRAADAHRCAVCFQDLGVL